MRKVLIAVLVGLFVLGAVAANNEEELFDDNNVDDMLESLGQDVELIDDNDSDASDASDVEEQQDDEEEDEEEPSDDDDLEENDDEDDDIEESDDHEILVGDEKCPQCSGVSCAPGFVCRKGNCVITENISCSGSRAPVFHMKIGRWFCRKNKFCNGGRKLRNGRCRFAEYKKKDPVHVNAPAKIAMPKVNLSGKQSSGLKSKGRNMVRINQFKNEKTYKPSSAALADAKKSAPPTHLKATASKPKVSNPLPIPQMKKNIKLSDLETQEVPDVDSIELNLPVRQKYVLPSAKQQMLAVRYNQKIFQDDEDLTSDVNDIQVKVYTDAATDTAYVIFRGSETNLFSSNIQDWLHNFNAVRTTCVLSGCDGKMQVHSGFQKGTFTALEAVVDALNDTPYTKIVVGGYSLGGALALLTAFDLLHNPDLKDGVSIALVTFGQPRATATNAVALFNKVLGTYPRYVNWQKKTCNGKTEMIAQDLVPTVPPTALGYEHVGSLKDVIWRQCPCDELNYSVSPTYLNAKITAHMIENYITSVDAALKGKK